ncbi:MAG: blue light receptor [Cirrosporium novae-zelandiae]|nr:MAG: blue light receptor [Cirrosporium novae-zelandiae]
MFGNGGDLGTGQSANMDTPMNDLLGTPNPDILSNLDVDTLPMNLEVNLIDPESRPYTSMETSQPAAETSNPVSSTSATNTSGVLTPIMTGAGAGPLPHGFGAQAPTNNGSTLTEFTKRRNWSQRVLEELKDFLHILTPDGRILYVSPSTKYLTGWTPDDLLGKFIGDFVHSDDSTLFMREFNESIASGKPLRFFYRFRKEDGTFTIFETHGHPHLTSETTYGPSAAGFCRGFFMMARPYPTKNASLLDSFLEHKIENERLTQRIAALKKEEQDDLEAQQAHWSRKVNGSNMTPSQTTKSDAPSLSITSGSTYDHTTMPPPAKPGLTDGALTESNLDAANIRPDSINDKMARYEGATHIETIEMLTGLRYREGERSQGISTGDASPALIKGDAGIAIPMDKEGRDGGEKKKKLKAADEYVCTDCGTLDSPEWRKGPNGPKSLCNACGLRWAKREKKARTAGNPNPQANSQTPTSQPPPGQQVVTSSNELSNPST